MTAKGLMVLRKYLRNAMCVVVCSPLLIAPAQLFGQQVQQEAGKPRPRDLCQSGVRLLQVNKIEEAAAVFLQAIKAFPHFAPAYHLLGVCYSRMGKTELANQAFLEAVHFDPQSSEAYNSLGASYVALGKLRQAADQFEKSAALKPSDPSPLFNLGRARLQLKQATAARSALLEAQKLSPNDIPIALALGEAYFMAGEVNSGQTVMASICSTPQVASDLQIAAGEVLLNNGHLGDAQTCFLHATMTDASAGEKILSLSSHLVETGDYQMSLQVLLPFKEKMDQVASYHDLVGFAYAKLGEPMAAVESLQKALRLDPSNENYYLDLGQILNEYGDYQAAIQLFQWGVSAHPKSARLYVGLALAYSAVTRMKEASDAAEKAAVLEPTLETAYTTLAIIYEGEKAWESLLNEALRLQKLNPQNYRGWYYEARALMENQNGEQSEQLPRALGSLRHTIELEPAFPLAHFQLGKLLFQQKEYSQAMTELKRAVELKSDYVEAHFLLATAFRKVGDLQHSQEELEIHRKLTAAIASRTQPHLDLKIERPY